MIRKIFVAAILSVIFLAAQDVSAEPNINYRVHMQDYGWRPPVGNNGEAGAIGKGKRLEAIVINCPGIEYCAHIENYGWQNWVRDGQVAGTVGESLRLEALRIRLRGNMADRYDIYYRVYVRHEGWLNWVRNGRVAGAEGRNLRVEAVQIRLVNKNNGYDDDYDEDDRYDSYNRRRDGRRW